MASYSKGLISARALIKLERLIQNYLYIYIYIKKEGLAITIWTLHYIIPLTPNIVTVDILDEKNKFLSDFLIILTLDKSDLYVKVNFTSSLSLLTLILINSCSTSMEADTPFGLM